MPIIACGMSHKTARIDLREKAFFAEDKLALYLQDLLTNENVREAVLLSTCNRSEIYCDANDVETIVEWFCRQHQLSREVLQEALYIHTDQAAVKHIMQVACGLDSMVLGEPQILGQMKDAFSESVAASSIGNLFNRLFQQVFAVAKEVRTNTSIGACPVSISSSAVSLLRENFVGDLRKANILLLGAGDTVSLVLRYLTVFAPENITIMNRSIENATVLAEKFQAKTRHFSQLAEAIQVADICISATNSAVPIVTTAMLKNREQPICILDLAVPRDVAANATELQNVKLFSIDDLRNSISHNLRGREHAAIKAEEMIAQKTADFMRWMQSVDAVTTTISAYRKQMEELCHAELVKFRKQLERGDDPVEVLTHFAQSLTNKLLHHPSVQLRQAGFEGRFDLLELARQLFALPKPEVELS